ncbi:MAG TPA: type II secretion system protein GspM, partial [Hyphomicrobiaceae bacterium]|nr:type II secretion system protein GspM [Hyphomicrobiaceae bacterium]
MRPNWFRSLIPLSLLGAFLALLCVVAMSGFVLTHMAQPSKAEKSGQLAVLRARVQDLAAKRMAKQAGNVYPPDGELFAVREADGIAGARLQSELIALVAGKGGSIVSAQVQPGEADGRLRKVTVDVAVETSIEGLRRVLQELESNGPVAFVERITVKPIDERLHKAPAGLVAIPVMLSATLRVSTFMLGGGKGEEG